MIAAAAALLGTVLAGVDGTAVGWEVAWRAEGAARTVAADRAETRSLAELDVLPRLGLLLDRKTLRLALGYAPQLRVVRDLGVAGLETDVAHGGTASAEWDLDPLWRLSGAARASVRLLDVGSPAASSAGLVRAEASATVRYLDAGASLGVEGRLTRRLAVRSTLAVESSSGLGTDGRAAIPPLRQARLAARVARDLGPRDVVRVDGSTLAAELAPAGTASVQTVTAGWTRRATRALELRLGAGASAARTRAGPLRFAPELETGLELAATAWGRPLRAAATARAGVGLDRWTGARERIDLGGELGWAPTPRWTLSTSASRGWVRERLGVALLHGDVRAAWRASPRLTLTAGAFAERQDDPAAAATLSTWGSTLGVEVTRGGRL